MEDPWANAWGEQSKSTFSQPSSSNWSAPSVHGDREDDISTRSWSVEPTTTRWDESNVITEASLWSNEPSSTWQPAQSTFDTIPLSTGSVPLPQFPTAISEEPERPVSSSSSSLSQDDTPPLSSPISQTPPHSHSPPPKPLHLSRPATPDVFGTFKGAAEFDEPTHETWSPATPVFSLPSVEADAWGPSWGESNQSNSVEEPETTHELDNAWETAKQQKEKQDLHVPPELLASILRQLEEMSGELWPDTDASTSASENERILDVETVIPASIAQRFMPEDMTLPSNVQFAKTFISKQLAEALKLTKHAPQTPLSPMAMYMSSKGSTSWEASIKSQPNITHDDFAPAGWKIVEAAKENTVVDDGKKKTGSGLLSFFGRRSAISQSDAVSRPASPPVNNPIISSLATGSSPRVSADNMGSTTTVGSSQGSGRTTPALPIAISSSSSISTQKNDSTLTASSVASDSIVRESTPPPSAVSRFFGRFSSRANKPRDSLALSQDDLEFLSDVPTFTESESGHGSELDTLGMMIKSPPLPMTLPPPLAPPPRPSQPTRSMSQTTKFEKDPMNDDPFSIFNSSDSASKHAYSPMNPLTASSPSVGAPLLNLSLSSNASPLAHSRNSGSTASNQGWSSFGDLPAPANGILPVKRPVVASMTPPNSSTPPPVPESKPNAAFPILSRGSSSQNQRLGRDSLASGSTGVISPFPPPPGSRSHTPVHTTLSVQVAANFDDDDDDDFSEFLSSPAQSPPPAPPSSIHNVLAANSSSSVGQIPTTTNSIFDGFDDFLEPFSSDPQPPQPPAKPKPQPFAFPPNFPPSNTRRTPSTQSPPQRQHSRTVSKADHSRTMSLLENVAARGQWLGPAARLPEALPPPVSNSSTKPPSNDLFKYGSTMQAQQAQTQAALSASFQVPTLRTDEKNRSQNSSRQPTPAHLFRPPMSSQPPLPTPPMLHPSSMNAAVSPAEVKSGGLSAQDLSFFEGL
ncbi:hypothetical protein BYT27DRAFT_7247377 [Phlegmacium glaucopus]|nr:hypothetical protein BYT27DRAFT_7247377 [Phlegmacium glaucopus]